MNTENTGSARALLLRDDEGQYCLLPQATLDQCRLPAEQAAALDRELAGDDVRGYLACASPISGWSVSSGGDRPMESVSLNFTKISFGVASTAAFGSGGGAGKIGQ
ncbi:MAG: hypothetical protein ACYDCQ_15415 [Dehalococcoidia bacterium]